MTLRTQNCNGIRSCFRSPHIFVCRAARDIRIFQIVGVCLILSAVPLQWIAGLESIKNRDKSAHQFDDPNNFEYLDLIFTVASLAGLFLLMWFSWLPGTVSRPCYLLSQLPGCGCCCRWPCLDKNPIDVAPQGYSRLPSDYDAHSRSARLTTRPIAIDEPNGRSASVSVARPGSAVFSPTTVSAPRAFNSSMRSPVDSLAVTVTDKDPVIGSLPSVVILAQTDSAVESVPA